MAFDFSPYQAVLLDLDGTIYHEEHPLPGAIELIRRLQREERIFACLSNSTSSPQRVVHRLHRMGVEVDVTHVYTAGAAAVDYVMESYGPEPRVYNLATEGIHEMLEGRVRWVQTAQEPCDAIVIGAPSNVYATEERQRTALVLAREGAVLIGICADRVYPSSRGMEFGSGALSHLMGYAAARQPVFTGKPQEVFFRKLCQRIGVVPERCLLVGDNLESDIGGGSAVGMKTVLTLTGVARREDVAQMDASRRPIKIIDGLSELL